MSKQYGLRIRNPKDDPLNAPHLLGPEGFVTELWFDSESERDRHYEINTRPLPYYRQGDVVTDIVEKIEREQPAP